MLLDGLNGEIELDVTGYQFPDYQNKSRNFDYDANWLILSGKKDIKGKKITGAEPCLLTTDVQRLISLLDSYQNENIDEINFGTMEPNFWVHLKRGTKTLMEIFFWCEGEKEKYKHVIPLRKVVTDTDIRAFKEFWEQILVIYPLR